MKVILLSILLSLSSMAFAHPLGDSHSMMSNQLHVLFSLHHLPMLILVALAVAVISLTRVRGGGKRR